MTRNRVLALVAIGVCVLVVGIGFWNVFTPTPPPERRILPELDPLPPSESPIYPDTHYIDNVILRAEVQFFMFMPHSGYNTFQFHLEINITNNADTPITNFNATKASVFFENSTLLYTFGLEPTEYQTIPTNESRNLAYEEDRDMPVVYSNLAGNQLYLRVHVTFNNITYIILTTALTPIAVAIE
ncbi:MAG: hypothetical protein KAR33_07405 [Candidatus Thorarchaeota archaeon]|nr:hypothetical protein [Candidatus Thorarchaeota archaeon]